MFLLFLSLYSDFAMKYCREGQVGAFIRFLFIQVLCFVFVFLLRYNSRLSIFTC